MNRVVIYPIDLDNKIFKQVLNTIVRVDQSDHTTIFRHVLLNDSEWIKQNHKSQYICIILFYKAIINIIICNMMK